MVVRGAGWNGEMAGVRLILFVTWGAVDVITRNSRQRYGGHPGRICIVGKSGEGCVSRMSLAEGERRGVKGEGGNEKGGTFGGGITSIDELIGAMFGRKGGGGKSGGKVDDEVVLKTPVSSLEMGKGSRDYGGWHVILNMKIVCREGCEGEVKGMLKGLLELGEGSEEVLNVFVNQDVEDKKCFMVMERYLSKEAMAVYQKKEEYRLFMRNVQPLLEESIGISLCKEKDGQISHSYYPFGPPGEGGRDDMCFRVVGG